MLRFIVATAILLAVTITAQARSTPYRVDEFCGARYCGHVTISVFPPVKMPYREPAEAHCSHHGCRVAHRVNKRTQQALIQTVSSPSGCPSRAFCGCATSVKVFGHPVRDLYLAANWLRFPHAEPAPGMVAARHGHVFVIQEVLGGGMVLAWDPNSGGHQTHIHVRSLAGFSVRNPHGNRLARI